MKNIRFFLLMAAITVASCKPKTGDNSEHVSPDIVNLPATASGKSSNDKLPKIEFEETSFDFGTIHSGDEVSHEFNFTNVGDGELVISDARGSCGCTVPEFSKSPIAPGDKGKIRVTFHSSGQAGQVMKTVTVLANTVPNTRVLSISSEVIK